MSGKQDLEEGRAIAQIANLKMKVRELEAEVMNEKHTSLTAAEKVKDQNDTNFHIKSFH